MNILNFTLGFIQRKLFEAVERSESLPVIVAKSLSAVGETGNTKICEIRHTRGIVEIKVQIKVVSLRRKLILLNVRDDEN